MRNGRAQTLIGSSAEYSMRTQRDSPRPSVVLSAGYVSMTRAAEAPCAIGIPPAQRMAKASVRKRIATNIRDLPMLQTERILGALNDAGNGSTAGAGSFVRQLTTKSIGKSKTL